MNSAMTNKQNRRNARATLFSFSLFFIIFTGEKLPFLGRVHKRTILPLSVAGVELIDRAQFDLIH